MSPWVSTEYLIQQDSTLAGIQQFLDDLVFGSVHEDDNLRYFFHFLPGLASTTASCDSLEWGFLDEPCTAQALGIEITMRNTHRWQDAVLQASSGEGFSEIGYVLHLLEDLGSPAHTRNDPHPEIAGDPDPFEVHNEDKCATPGSCIPTDSLIIPSSPNPQEFFIDLRDFVASNFFSNDTIKTDIFAPSEPCDFLKGDPDPCGPTATRLEGNYYIELKDGKKRKIARRGFFGPYIDKLIAQEQFNELAPQIVRHIASLIKFYIETANPPFPAPEPTAWNEDFEELNLGEIGGQGHWVFFTGDGDVDDSQAFAGSRSLRLDNDGTRLLMPGGFLSDFGSMVTSYLRIGMIDSGAGGVMYFNDHQNAAPPATLSCHLGHFYVPGHIAFNNETLKAITENTWYKLDVEFDYGGNRCRGRADNESWSAWQDQGIVFGRALHVAFIGSVGFAQTSTHEVWFDDISISEPVALPVALE